MPSSSPSTEPGVLFVANFRSDVGYAWRFIEELWLAIARHPRLAGHRFHVAFPVVGTVSPQLREGGFEIHERAFPGDLRDLGSFLRRHRIRVVYLSDRPFCSWIYGLCRLHGVKTVIVHDHSPGTRQPPGPVRGIAKSLACRSPALRCDAGFGVGAFVVDRMVEVNRMPRERVFRVTNGIEPGPPPEPRPESDGVRIITVARATEYKGIDLALDAMAELVHRRGRRDVRYELCGDGPDLERFRRRAEEARLGEFVEFPGLVSDVPRRLARADVAFHPSRGEALSLAILEYMRSGLPVVVSDNPSVNSPLTDGVDARFYPEGDAKAAATVLEELVVDRALRLEMGRAARRSLEEGFTRANMLRELDEAISAALD